MIRVVSSHGRGRRRADAVTFLVESSGLFLPCYALSIAERFTNGPFREEAVDQTVCLTPLDGL
jgi:hypothetical protein